MGSINSTIAKVFEIRDELSFRNIRGGLWPVLLILPLAVIMGDLRYFDLQMQVAGLESYEWMLVPLGLGWLVTALIPRQMVIPFLRIAAVLSAVILPFQIFSSQGMGQFALFMAFEFLNGVCASCAFSLFCFELNNVERLFGMAIIQFYYGFYYTFWRAFPAVEAAGKTWIAAAVMALFLVVVFACAGPLRGAKKKEKLVDTNGDGKGSAFFFILILDFVYYVIMCMINYIEWAEESVHSLAFGVGSFIAIAVIFFIQILSNRNALYIWLLFLVLSLLGLGALLYDSPVMHVSGSFAYGLGDGLGYIVLYYICAGILKQSRSFKLFRLYCVLFFFEYCVVSGVFTVLFKYIDAPNKILAFGVVLGLGCICIFLVPLMQKRLFETDWSDGLHLGDMAEYVHPFEETEALNTKNHLDLTPREEEVFTMLLLGKAPKEIAWTLKVTYDTVCFHQKNLYRKLGIQSRSELFARYSHTPPQ